MQEDETKCVEQRNSISWNSLDAFGILGWEKQQL